MTEKDINIEDKETLNEAPVDETDKEAEATEETADAEISDKAEAEEKAEEKDPLEEAQAQIADLKDKYLRQVAEFDNYRKRTMKERAELILNGSEKTISALLPVIDDMERAIANGAKTDDPQVLREGMELIYQKLMKALEAQGVSKIETRMPTSTLTCTRLSLWCLAWATTRRAR